MLVDLFCTVDPLLIRMSITNELCEVDDRAEHVAEPIEVLDDFEELIAIMPGPHDALREEVCADESSEGEVLK